MSKDIWHRYDEAPRHQDIIMTDTGCWAYRADLLALETENKDLSDKIGKLETELERTRKALEQSEICCTEWEKQALDYKAENIALSGDLERTRKALDVAVDALKTVKRYLCEMPAPDGATVLRMTCESATTVKKALEQITAPEQKDKL